MLAALPVVTGLLISSISPGYMEPLFNDRWGHIAIGIAIVMELVGFFVIQRIVNIDV